jgi:hypothetical protein
LKRCLAALSAVKPFVSCVPSQKGLSPLPPQRQSQTRFPSGTWTSWPVGSTMVSGPTVS